MIRVEVETTIKRPVEEVFDRLTDLPGYNQWMSTTGLFRSSEKTSEGPVGEGTTFTDKVRNGLAVGEITKYEKPHRVKFRQTVYYRGIKLMESRPGYSLEPQGDHTRVYHLAEGNMFGIFKLFEPFFVPVARAERKRTVRDLKRSLENE